MRLLLGLAILVATPSCYLAHERDVDAAASDAPTCALGVPTTVTFDPPLAPGHLDAVRILGMESPPATPTVILHLDTCPMADAPCPHDAIIGAMGIGFAIDVEAQVPPPGFTGFLEWNGRTLYMLFIDGRHCASCGGELEILAGDLVAPLNAASHEHDGALECQTTCGDDLAVAIDSHGMTVSAASGGVGLNSPLTLWVSSGIRHPCVRCDCAAEAIPATGLFVGADGVFAVP